ncbi:MAG TPA: DUF397 domain-containing protein [Micromonosporaceae bacterium]|nr:DUF397 domain-containing protein [Micromonosporaceae bacterium]
MKRSSVSWRRSTLSNGEGNCVEVAWIGDRVATRDSKDPAGPVIVIDGRAWYEFLAAVKSDEFN